MPKGAGAVCKPILAVLYLLLATSVAWATPHTGIMSTTALDFPGFCSPAAPEKETARLRLTGPSRAADDCKADLAISMADDATAPKPPAPRVYHAVGEEPSPRTQIGPFYYPNANGLVDATRMSGQSRWAARP